MAKKSSRPNLPQQTLERARRELARSGDLPEPVVHDKPAEDAPVAEPVVKPRRAVMTTEAELRAEYAYVVADLRQMAILAAGLLAVLVVSAFFLA